VVYTSFTQTYTELQAATDGLVAASTEHYALLKTKYKQIKEDKTSLRGVHAIHLITSQDANVPCSLSQNKTPKSTA
jgi:hypothetical protein